MLGFIVGHGLCGATGALGDLIDLDYNADRYNVLRHSGGDKKSKTDYGTCLCRSLKSKRGKILEELKFIVKIDSETHSGLLSPSKTLKSEEEFISRLGY